MAKNDDDIFELLVELPWWIGVCTAAVVFVALRFVVPSIAFENPVFKVVASVAPQFAWLAVFFLIPAGISALASFRKRELLDRQSGIDSIRSLSWRKFEELTAEAYRRQGFAVKENTSTGPDGGVDLIAERHGNIYLIQCKQWRVTKVGVRVVREMFGVMHDQHATGVIIVTSGMFTQEARNFAEGKPIDLVEGKQLSELVRNVQAAPRVPGERDTDHSASLPKRLCPACGCELVVRTAKRGNNIGSRFWGCSSFPRCRHTQPYAG